MDRVERWPKDDFPTDAVYRNSRGPELRLVTCGGTFDSDARRYRDNVIVFARAIHGVVAAPQMLAPLDRTPAAHRDPDMAIQT